MEVEGEVATLRVVLGPQDEMFTDAARRVFLESEFRVRESSDRVGCRLQGPALAHRGAGEIPSEGMLPGCIQVPPDGQPIVMAADGPTTGGYPKIATVIRADHPALAQLVPGVSRVRFAAVTVEEAVAAMMAR
jgi:allophanate hydrolase subunit 2